MKKAFIWLIVIVLIIVGSVWGTLMYLTDEVTKTNTMTIGNVGIELLEFERENTETAGDAAKVQNFNDAKRLIPAVLTNDFNYDTKDAIVKWDKDINGNTIKPSYTSPIWDPADINNEEDKMVFVKNTGKRDAYVRIFFAFEAGNYTSFTRFKDMVHINLNDAASEWAWEWNPVLATSDEGGNYFIATATYLPILKSGEFTTISLSQIALDSAAENYDVDAFGGKYDVKVCAQGIQSEGFDTAAQALTEGFGDDIPFTNLKFVTPVDLKTALHYLNGDKTSDVLVGTSEVSNDKVSSVTFGLAKDHYAAVSGYKGVLTANGSEENKFTAYTYYVQNADGKYDIYVLSDEGEIYAPKNCDSLFLSMSSLSTVDTSNLNVSGTTSMKLMFSKCSKLKSIDVSRWDVSNVTDMASMFNGCSSLTSLDVSNFNTAKTTTLASMFDGCSKLESVDMSGWDVSAVASTAKMFFSCSALKSLNFSGWHPTSLKNTELMFHKCGKLKILDLSSWGSVPLENISQMFIDCYELTTIYVSRDWPLENIKRKYSVFRDNTKLVGEAGQPFETKFVQGEEKYEDFARIAKDGTPGYFTYKAAENTTPEQKQ